MKENYSPREEKEWGNLINEFRSKSDRSVGILGTVYLDTYLKQLLQGFFIDDPEAAALLLGDEFPLGSFSARIKISYCLGLISADEYHDLKLILEIRNAFSANMGIRSFAADTIRETCYLFKTAKNMLLPGETITPRRLFVFTCTILVQHLALRAVEAANERRTIPDEFFLVSTGR
jgi:DNA-binding MltR family transcriptional regulator